MIKAQKVTLSHPITLDGKKLKELYVRAPRYVDLTDDEGGNFINNQPGMVRLAVHCTEISEGGAQIPGPAIDQLAPVDILKLMGALQYFFIDEGQDLPIPVKKDTNGSATEDNASQSKKSEAS